MTAISNIRKISILELPENIAQLLLELEIENQNLKSEITSLEYCLEMDRILMEKNCHINCENIFSENDQEVANDR